MTIIVTFAIHITLPGYLYYVIMVFLIIIIIILLMMHNLGQNICRLFHVFAQFLFSTSEAELDYYHQKVNVRVAERLKT